MKIRHTPSQLEKAEELLQVLSIWGVTRVDAVAIGHLIASSAADITDKKYKALSGGAYIKPMTPAPSDQDFLDLIPNATKAN